MSGLQGLPPRPPGVPLRPTGDSYRPPPPPSSQHFQNRGPERFDPHKLRGNGYARHDDNYQPVRRSPREYLEVESPRRVNNTGDSYRPPSNDFSFRVEPPPSTDLSRISDSYRPAQSKPSEYRAINQANSRLGNNRQERNRQGGRGRGGAYNRAAFTRKAAERPFLVSTRASTPDLMPGMEETDGPVVKYRALEELSDSDEADMDVSSDENEGKDRGAEEQPKKKQARTDLNKSADGDSVPRWSNPDPYTVLPPPDESQRKKMDVVKLIRKARVVSSSDAASKTEPVTDDFISFDFNDDVKGNDEDSEESVNGRNGGGVPGKLNGRHGFSHLESMQKLTSPTIYDGKTRRSVLDTTSDPALGNRKRTVDDEIKDGPTLPAMPAFAIPKRASDGSIVPNWRVDSAISPTPWCTVDHAATENMGYWLHKEIMDFYHHVKPTGVEDYMRSELVNNLRISIRRRWRDADIHPFGSFVAGLYLPTADMDLVFVSKDFMNGRRPIYSTTRFLLLFRNHLQDEGLAARGSIEVISKARVPLVKYVDEKTGLRVDVSFENSAGIIANKTYKEWKDKYPAMPILVTLIKQFLTMRGLNEPVNGGIGGFTVTCLVINLLQLLPQVQSGNMIPEHHLGEILMEFLDLYGNEFDAVTTAIRLHPPGWVSKTYLSTYNKGDKREKLCIIDPNNSANDIAGGSKNTPTILAQFKKAYKDLQARMGELQSKAIEQRRGQSIIGVILAGNYSSFELQREHLRKCYSRR